MMLEEELLEIIRKGEFDWHGYDYENVVSSACEHGAECLDRILCAIEENGGDVDRLAWEIDDDGYTAMYLYAAQEPDIMDVFAKHGVDTTREIKSYLPFPSSSRYDPYVQSRDHESLEKLGRELLGERMRQDGAARRIDHAANVVAMLKRWEIKVDFYGYYSAAAWCLGVLDDISDPAIRKETEERIHRSFHGMCGEDKLAMDALRLLAFDGTKFHSATEHIHHIAETAGLFELAMAIADRLCLVREWLARPGGRPTARAVFEESRPVFEKDPPESIIFPNPFTERIPAEIKNVRAELDAAELVAWEKPVPVFPE